MIFDSVYDIYRGVITYIRVIDGKITPRERIQMMSTRAIHELLEVGVISPEPKPDRRARGRRGRLPDHRGEGRPAVQGRRHHHLRAQGRDRAARRLPRAAADGLLRAVPDGRLGLPGAARRAGQAAAQRRRADLRAGDLRRARLRLPLRLSRAAAPGDHPRPPGAGVRARPDLHGAERRLPRQDGGRRRASSSPTRRTGRPARSREVSETDRQVHDHHPERVHRHDHGAVPVPARRVGRHGLSVRDPGRAALHDAAGRDHLRLLRRAEVAHPRLRLAGLRGDRQAGGRPGQGGHPAAGRGGGRVLRDRAQGLRLRLRRLDDGQAARADPAAAVRGADPGRGRLEGHRPREDPRDAQGRAGQVLRRRHHPQAQAAGEAEGGQEADEDGRPGRGPAGGLHRRAVHRRRPRTRPKK